MGYSQKPLQTITVTFDNTGVYTFDSLKVVCQPMENIGQQTRNLAKNVLTDIKVESNRISGRISLSKPKVLLLSLPYSQGFRAYVDGEETEIIQANTMYMALELTEGDHEIQLVYCTPWLRTGAGLTFAGAVCYIGVVLWNHFRKKKRIQKI